MGVCVSCRVCPRVTESRPAGLWIRRTWVFRAVARRGDVMVKDVRACPNLVLARIVAFASAGLTMYRNLPVPLRAIHPYNSRTPPPSWKSWFGEVGGLDLQSRAALYASQRPALLVEYDRGVDRVDLSVERVALEVDVGQGVVTGPVARVSSRCSAEKSS